jgi:hypothetical protein
MNRQFLFDSASNFNFVCECLSFLAHHSLSSKKSRRMLSLQQCALNIRNILTIFEMVISKYKETTSKETLRNLIRFFLFELCTEVLITINNQNNSLLILKSTVILNSLIGTQNHKNNPQENLSDLYSGWNETKKYQKILLEHSTLILRHIELGVNSLSDCQKQSSILFVYYILFDNPPACSLFKR